jgi:hypothetical protein
MKFVTRQSTEGDVLFVEPEGGPYVAIQADAESGEWCVYVNTEQHDEHTRTRPDGSPYIDVYLNDATLYDGARGLPAEDPWDVIAQRDLYDHAMKAAWSALDREDILGAYDALDVD